MNVFFSRRNIYVYMCMYMYVCVHIYIYTHISILKINNVTIKN